MENILCETLPYGLIRISGAEALPFLQNQFSNDLRPLRSGQAQLSSYSNVKGRMLANFLLQAWGGDYWLYPSADVQSLVQERLSKYRMRAKVDIEDATQAWTCFGLAGPHSTRILTQALGGAPEHGNSSMAMQGGWAIRLSWPGTPTFLLTLPTEAAPAARALLHQAGAETADTQAWRLHQIRAGIGMISLATCERWIPQELNLEALGAISFNKGCYPGQEIIARSKYLGKLKNSLYHLAGGMPFAAGTAIYGDSMGEQAIGQVIDGAAAEQGFEYLAVLRDSCVAEDLRAEQPGGSPLRLLS